MAHTPTASVAVVGSVNLDLVVQVPRLPGPGQTVLGAGLVMQPGGKGANQAVAAQRLGARAVLFGAIGDDAFGAGLRAALEAEGLDLSQLAIVAGTPTGVAMIPVATDGENAIVVAPGANAHLSSDHLAALPQLLGTQGVLLLQLEVPLYTCIAAAGLARQAGATVILNAAPLDGPLPAELLSTVDVLVVNESEARQLLGMPWQETVDWPRRISELRALGPDSCVITLGPQGAVAATADAVFVQPPFPVRAVDTTGAGDSFCGALAVTLAHRQTFPTAIRHGCAAGALAATKIGAQQGLPTASELAAFLS